MTSQTTSGAAPRYMRPAATCKHLQISRSTLYLWVANRHDFPKPIKAGPRVTLFDALEIDRFMAGL